MTWSAGTPTFGSTPSSLGFPSVSVRTLFSRSVLTIEQHPFGLWVVELRYAPAPGTRGRFTVRMNMQMAMVMNGREIPLAIPPMMVTTDTMVTGTTERVRMPRQPLAGARRKAVEKIVNEALASRPKLPKL